jgi:hypothetical protein
MTRAADDFPAIRARLEELRRERSRVAANNDRRRADGLQSYDIDSDQRRIPESKRVVDHFKERPAF